MRAKRAIVKYRDKRIPNIVDNAIVLDDVFTKDISFKHQEEYRILLDMEVEDHFILEIGSIEDISKVNNYSVIKNGLKVKYEVTGTMPED
ncbi:hypothetical protein [Clostridium cellulovorans]|uniref:Uncharacterized protein n=1 Tax=Clostridium cellulovorans (strain ATCC 35296 / DSM 3052 / OCM 3 / 743B) TaxID=573061 RepID=D9SX19_CLOC7|nr:hypothetical protein [Clostridium cellulovorans]ADL51380.1 hypothetical protein Clocel_1634 [Clostridium cellulovorans 743B]